MDRHIRVIAVTNEEPSINLTYLRKNGVVPESGLAAEETGIMIEGTPTLILVRRDGAVISSWQGLLSTEEQGEVRAAIKKAYFGRLDSSDDAISQPASRRSLKTARYKTLRVLPQKCMLEDSITSDSMPL